MWRTLPRRIVTVGGGVGGLWQYQSDCHYEEDQKKITPKITPTNLYSSSFPANNPCEDRIFVHDEGNLFQAYGVFDGHGGWQVSDYIFTNISSILCPKLNNGLSVETSLRETFHELEINYLETIREAYRLGYGDVAKVGSCVNLSIVQNDILTVANSGDCRTIIGSDLGPIREKTVSSEEQNPVIATVEGHLFTCYHVGRDHNARTALEQFLLSRDHPNESNIVKCKNSHACYVKGRLQLTRAIGDLYLKSNDFNAPSDSLRARYGSVCWRRLFLCLLFLSE
jgi:pyruvate dehydrogenase phosphatase